MNEIVTINNKSLKSKIYNNQKVITFKDIDMVHERVEGTAKRNFLENKNKLIRGIDYFELTTSQKNEIRTFEIPNRGITVLTASGYLMLVKSLNDDLAWKVQRELVNNYFTMLEIKKKRNKPIDRALRQHMNIAMTLIQNTGVKAPMAYAIALSEAEKETGYSYNEYKKLLPSPNYEIGYLNPTKIGEKIGLKPAEVNKKLEKMGLQAKIDKEWRLTDEGKKYGEEQPYTRNGHSSYHIQWNDEILKIFDMSEVV